MRYDSSPFSPQANNGVHPAIMARSIPGALRESKEWRQAEAFVKMSFAQRPEKFVLAQEAFDGAVLKAVAARRHINANRDDPSGLLEWTGKSHHHLVNMLLESTPGLRDQVKMLTESTDPGINVSADFAVLSNQLLLTVLPQMEALHISDLVDGGVLQQPMGWIAREGVYYADATAYEAGADAVTHLDPDMSLAPIECAVSKRMKIGNELESVTAETRRLSAEFSFEAAQNAQTGFGINLSAALANTIGTQVDREVQMTHLSVMLATAGCSEIWVATPTSAYDGLNPKEYIETLLSVALVNLDLQHKNAPEVAHGSTVVAGNHTTLAYFEQLYQYRKLPGGMQFGAGMLGASTDIEAPFFAGKKITDFRLMPDNVLLTVVKDGKVGPARIDCPYGPPKVVFAPLQDPRTGCTAIGIGSRRGMHNVRPNAIGRLDIEPAT